MAFPRNENHAEHYGVRAWIMQDRSVRRVEPYSRVTFRQIYQNRPDEAHYVVAAYYNVALSTDRYVVWDLFEAVRNGVAGHNVYAPKPRLTHDDLDAAITATVMLYGKEVE